jgi:16S rRNA G966 N2-methylase RsmD
LSCYPLSKKQKDYAARDSCVLLMAYLKNILPTDNSFKIQTRQNKFYFCDGFDSEDDDYNNDNNKQYALLDKDQNKQSNSLETFNKYIETEAEALTANKDEQQPAASKRIISFDEYKNRNSKMLKLNKNIDHLEININVNEFEYDEQNLADLNMNEEQQSINNNAILNKHVQLTKRIMFSHFRPHNFDLKYDSDNHFGQLFIDPLFEQLMGKAVKWMILRNGNKENLIVSFEKRVNKEEILTLINDYNKEEVH